MTPPEVKGRETRGERGGGGDIYISSDIRTPTQAADTRGVTNLSAKKNTRYTCSKQRLGLDSHTLLWYYTLKGGSALRILQKCACTYTTFSPTYVQAYLQECLRDERHRADGAPHPGRQEGQQQQPVLSDERAGPAVVPAGVGVNG